MSRIKEIEDALVAAHRAGDMRSAEVLAGMLKQEQNPSIRQQANNVLNTALEEPTGERSALQRATVDPIRRGARHVLGAGQEIMNDPMSALRGMVGLGSDLAESAFKLPGAVGIGAIEGATTGSPLKALNQFRQSFETELPGGVGGLSKLSQIQQSPTYRAGAAAMELGDVAAQGVQQGYTGLAQGAFDTLQGKLPFQPGQEPGVLAQNIGALANIGLGVGSMFTPSMLARPKPGASTPVVPPTERDRLMLREKALEDITRRGQLKNARDLRKYREAIDAKQSTRDYATQRRAEAYEEARMRALRELDPGDVENLEPWQLAQAENTFFKAQPDLFPETLSSPIPTIDPAKMQPKEEFPFSGRSELQVQRDLFDNPARPVDTGLEPTSGRTGGEMRPTVERLRDGEFVDVPVRQKNPARYKGLPADVVAFANQNPDFSSGLDYWQSRLEDQNLIYDKAQFDSYTRRDMTEIGELLKQINALDKERKDALVRLSDPNEYSSLEGDKVFQFQKINDAKEAEIQPLVARLDEIWGKLQTRMKAREDAPKTRTIYSTDPNAPSRAGALTTEKTEPFNLGAPEGDRTPFNPNKRINKNAGKGLSLEGEELPPAREGAVAIGPRVPIKKSNPLSGFNAAFWKWFGESKVVDAEGNPLEVYHGTSKDKSFDSFKAPRNGIWFSLRPEIASQYAIENDSRQTVLNPNWTGLNNRFITVNTAPRVIPTYLSIKNPKVLASFPDGLISAVNYKKAQSEYFDKLKREGYDGVIIADELFVAFESNQVKSSRFNRGTWDGTKKDISKQSDLSGLSVKTRRRLVQESRIIDAVLRGDLKGGLEEAAAYGSSWEKAIAKTLLANLNSIGDLRIMSLSQVPDTAVKQEYTESSALYDPNTHTIVMGDIKEGLVSRTLLHEVLHAYTHSYLSMALDNVSGMGQLASKPSLLKTAEKINDLYTHVYQRHPELRDLYGMTDVHEFVSEAFSNVEFREALGKIFVSEFSAKGTSYLVNVAASFWNRVVGMLNSMGLNIDYSSRGGRNALQQILDLGEEIITKGEATDRAMYDRTFREHDNITYPLKRAAANGNLASKVADVVSQFNIDRRNLSEVINDNGITIENARDKVKDISRNFVIGSKLMVDRSIAVLTENKGFVHDFVKNVVDRQQEIERKKQEGMESFSVGANWTKSRFGIESREEKGGILSALKKENISVEQAVLMKNTWLKAVGSAFDLGPDDFGTSAQWKAYSTIQSNIKKMWDQTNEARAKLKLAPVPYIRNYFPSQWEGDYRVFIRNPEGTLIDVRGAESRGQAKKLAKQLQEEFGADFNVTPDLASKSLRDVADLSVMDDIMRALENHPSEYAAVQRAYARVAGKRGFGSTALQRKGVLGALGYEEGQLGLRKLQKSLETYVNRQQTYVANIERQLILNEIAAMPRSITQHMGNAVKLMQDYLNEAKGRVEVNFVDHAMRAVGEIVGQGDGMAVRNIHRGSRLASFFYLATTNFLLAQPLQPVFAYPRLYKMLQEGETTLRPEVAFFGGYSNFFRAIVGKDPEMLGALNWARKNGYVEPALMQVMNDHMRDSAFRSTNKVGAGLDNLQSMFGIGTGWMEEWTVRAPSFFIYEKALQSTIKDPIKRYEAAGNMTDYYMVHYSQEALPAIYKQTGEVIGETMKPLKMFTHNYYGQFLEYLKYAKESGDIKSAAPLIGFVMGGMMIAGAAGSIATELVDLIISMFNLVSETTGLRNRDERVPTFKDLVASTNFGDKLANDLVTFGVPSAATGYNISGSVQAPQLKSIMEFPAVSFWGGIAKEAMNYGTKAVKGTATEGDEMKLLLATTPLAFRGAIEQMYSPDGGATIPNPNDDMRPLYRRDENEQFMAQGLNWRSTDEARYRQLVSAAKMYALGEREQRLAIMDKIYDGVRQGKGIDPKLVQKYAEAGGDVGNLTSNLMTRLKTQNTTWAERQFQRTPTPTSVNDRQTVQRYMGNPRAPSPPQPQPDALYKRGGEGSGGGNPLAIPETLEGIQQQGREQGTNLQFPAYSQSVDRLNKGNFPYGVGGFVKFNDPKTVNVNRDSAFKDQRAVFAHEATHTQQLEYTELLKREKEKGTHPKHTYSLGFGGNIGGYGRVSKMEETLRTRSNEVPEELRKKFELGGEFGMRGLDAGREFMADLQGAEAVLPAGQTILDTELGKFLFRTPEERRYYLTSSLPMTRKLLDRNPELFEMAVQKARTAKRVFKNEAVSKSYMRAAMQAIRALQKED